MKLLRDSIIYLGSSVINKAIPFLLLPVLTTYLSPEEYGVLSIYLIAITFYNALIGMNINVNITKNYFQRSKREMAIVVYNCLVILLSSFAIFFLITAAFSFLYRDIFSIPSSWFALIPVLSLLFMVITINLTIIRNQEKPLVFGAFEIGNTLVVMLVTVLLLVAFQLGWKSQVIGTAAGYVVFSLVSVGYMQHQGFISRIRDKKWIRDILKTSIPMIPHVLGGIVMAVSDRLFIERMIDLKTVGIYSVGYTFGLVVILFTDAFIKAWNPWFFKTLANPAGSEKRTVVKYTYLYILAVFALSVGIATMAKWILPFVVDQEFYGAETFIVWIALGYAVHGVYKIFFPYMVLINKTHLLAYSSTVAALVNLGLNYWWIKAFGAIGAAYATIAAFMVSTLLVILFQHQYYRMPWLFFKENQQKP